MSALCFATVSPYSLLFSPYLLLIIIDITALQSQMVFLHLVKTSLFVKRIAKKKMREVFASSVALRHKTNYLIC